MSKCPNIGAATHRKELKRYDVPGHARFLTFSYFQRRPFLTKDRSRTWVLDGIDLSRRTHGFDLWAFVIMPEHVHLLIYAGEAPHAVADIEYTLKKSVSNRAVAWVKANSPAFLERMADRRPNGDVCYRFWQRGGGYDRNLWTPQDVWEKTDYIHTNPVRRGLCAHPTDWPWSSARGYTDSNAGLLRIDFDSLPEDVRTRGRGRG